MAYRQVSPAELEGEELADWYRRTPDEIEEERRLRRQEAHDEFFGQGRWQEARVGPPPARPLPIRPAPPETRAAPQVGGAPPPPGAPGSFFGTYEPLPYSSAYLPGLPPPLNRVEATRPMPSMYQLSDGSIVSVQELERIHAEQQRRMRGEELLPSPYARAVDRWQDGQIPRPSQLEKGTWERDPTCHPYGGWEIDPGFSYYPERTQDYEEQVTGARGVDYVVRLPGAKRGVKFDGCDVVSPKHPLQEAKGPGYAGLIERAWKSTFGGFLFTGLQGQAQRQTDAAHGRPIYWFVAEKPAVKTFKKDIVETRPIEVKHVPAR